MPDIRRLALRDVLLAFGLGGGLMVMLLMGNVGGLWELTLATGKAQLSVLLLWAVLGKLIAAVMAMGSSVDDDDAAGGDDTRGGRRAPVSLLRIRLRNRRR